MQKYEYDIDDFKTRTIKEEMTLLNHRASLGWELVSVLYEGKAFYKYYYKRLIHI
jgi:hypothetical protein